MSLDSQFPLQPLPPTVSPSELQQLEAQQVETQQVETQQLESDILRPIPFHPDDSALRPTAPSGLELHLWFAGLSQGKQILTLIIVGLFLVTLIGVLLQLLALAIQLALVGIVAVLVFKFLISPTQA